MNTDFDNETDRRITNFSNVIIDCSGPEATFFNILVSVSYMTIMVVSLIGNGMVCYLVHFAPKFKSVTNIFIANLSLGDILMTLLCVPFSFISTLILHHWPFGESLCRGVSYFQAVSVFVSAYTLVAISLDRYIAILKPLRPRMTKSQAKIIILVVWVIAILTALPIGFVSTMVQPTEHHKHCELYICTEEWNDEDVRVLYGIGLAVLQYAIPLIVLVFTYTRIAIMVWGRQAPGEAENSRDERMANNKRKMIKMMVVVVVVFTLCWLPFNVLLLLPSTTLSDWSGTKYVYFGFHWLAMSHTCYNPAIYVYMNSRFRGGFLSVLSRIPCLRSLKNRSNHRRTMSFAMSVVDNDMSSSLRRTNTCTTYISTRSKNGPLTTSRSIKNQHIVNCNMEPEL